MPSYINMELLMGTTALTLRLLMSSLMELFKLVEELLKKVKTMNKYVV
jgi:hypothetical protein